VTKAKVATGAGTPRYSDASSGTDDPPPRRYSDASTGTDSPQFSLTSSGCEVETSKFFGSEASDGSPSHQDHAVDSCYDNTPKGTDAIPNKEQLALDQDLTTAMIRNIPCRFRAEDVEQVLDEVGFHGKYNHVRVPTRNRSNLGYCFVNFTEPIYLQQCAEYFYGRPFGNSLSEKLCQVMFATRQYMESSPSSPHHGRAQNSKKQKQSFTGSLPYMESSPSSPHQDVHVRSPKLSDCHGAQPPFKEQCSPLLKLQAYGARFVR